MNDSPVTETAAPVLIVGGGLSGIATALGLALAYLIADELTSA
jgi:cation diffusion facilitator CzcD-associated flavoprotein CzcO